MSVFIVVFLKAERVVILGLPDVLRNQRSEVLKNFKKLDWRAAAEWLRLTFPNDYRKPCDTRVEVNTAVVCSEERRQELVKQRERILAFELPKTE